MAAVDALQGLSSSDAAERRADGRSNASVHLTSRTLGGILRENIFTLFNAILTICFIAVLLLGDLRDGLFYGVVVANALIGIVQELRAKRVLDRLALLAAPTAAVKRDGVLTHVALADVVQDDVIVLRPGDQIPADARVLQGSALVIDEALLTGESEPVEKREGDALLSGSHVVGGAGYARATAVGAASYANRLTAEAKRHSLVKSELREATTRILVYLSWILGPVIAITLIGRFVLYGARHGSGTDVTGAGTGASSADLWHRAIADAVASVVGMVPEGLVLLTSLAFGVAAIQLARKKVLVQELAAVEVLARVDVLCLDKTGTLTTGEFDFDRYLSLDGTPPALLESVLGAFGADDAANLTARVLGSHFSPGEATVLARQPFSSAERVSGVTVRVGASESSWLLGAPERLLSAHPAELAQAAESASRGQRTLALVRLAGELNGDASPTAHRPTSLTPVALVVLGETLRSDAAATLSYLSAQGLRVIIMSGDNPLTVASIAGTLGLPGPTTDAGTLPDGDGLGDGDGLAQALDTSSLFGRVSPEQKRSAIALLQRRGHTVAMTGDGVNDALAIKDADLGIAMGTATAVTRAVSRIVLLDDRFAQLPHVLALGRRVIGNVERVANLFLSKTVYGILLALSTAVLAVPYPFLPRQLTLVGGLAIGIPAFLLALAPNERRYVPGVLRRVIRYAIPTGAIAAASVLAVFLPVHHRVSLVEARSVTTVALFLVSLWILCVLARPLNGWRYALLLGVSAIMVLACVLPWARRFFLVEVQWNFALVYGLMVGAIGAIGIEIVYRIARRRGVVFDRV
ncbi:HAD-IC family P-type ATPase [Glaciibacter psychrotolerans]|uniref:Cation-transporting ATPase E n=1 Tax=Glaciibacter psychrotolerans TaxID=670054 RepID=A0A7Z0J5D8_9MICO|nr:HAD-IC family P-type ATPase [Leifsonia psychrotolerans]NYJ19011.1 cation-transporting ATPase E [Leifsonia psychrotolerans]